jgi:cell division protease FtsH
VKRFVPIDTLPTQIAIEDAVEAACGEAISLAVSKLQAGTSVLIECDKELSLYLYLAIRDRIRKTKPFPKLVVIDGRPREGDTNPSALACMLGQLSDAIRGNLDPTVLVLLHLDVLTTTHTGLTLEARETIPLLYENPEAILLGFRDPSFSLPPVIEGVFSYKLSLIGLPRESLASLITQREAKVIDDKLFDPYGLYKYVSGLNPVRFRRLLKSLATKRESLPGRPQKAAIYRELRQQTLQHGVDVPDVDLNKDIGGYDDVKQLLQEDLISLLQRMEDMHDEQEIRTLEGILPRGIIFHGPPGTGKTYFAKALATQLNAALIVVSGPELKSKWVGQSEENLRKVFRQARQCAPALIVFDELDAFAHERGTYTGSGVEHSMVNQLLTEMDGFRSNERLLVIGTTNFLESLDSALLRPGRFEYLVEIPAPNHRDRRAIIDIYNRKFELSLSEQLCEHLARRTEGDADIEHGIPFSGDHLYAVMRALKRQALRTGSNNLSMADLDRALQRKTHRSIVLSDREEQVVAVHEAGHALLAMLIPEATPPERISIAADMSGALGYVLRAARAHPYALTELEMKADICVGLGGYFAEKINFGHVSIGARTDLQQATEIARTMVEEFGMSPEIGIHVVSRNRQGQPVEFMTESRRTLITKAIDTLLSEQAQRAEKILLEHQEEHQRLVQRLLKEKIIQLRGTTLQPLIPENHA